MKAQMKKLYDVPSSEPDRRGDGVYALGENRVCIKWTLSGWQQPPNSHVCEGSAHVWCPQTGWVHLMNARLEGPGRESVKKAVVDQLLGWCVMFFDGEE